MYWLIILNLYRFFVKTFTNEDVKLLNKVFFDIIKYCDGTKVSFVHLSTNLTISAFFKDVVFKFPPISRQPFSLMVVVLDQYPSLFLGLD